MNINKTMNLRNTIKLKIFSEENMVANIRDINTAILSSRYFLLNFDELPFKLIAIIHAKKNK